MAPTGRRLSASTHHTQNTKYSIDFDALRGPGSDVSSLPQIHRDEELDPIRTDDIDGPTDFTQNLEFWMRAPLREGGAFKPNITRPTHLRNETVAHDIQDYISSDEIEPSFQDEQDSVTRHDVSEEEELPEEEDDTIAGHDRGSEISETEQQERVLSFLDTLPEISTIDENQAKLAHGKASLQPTVEDAESTPRKTSYETNISPQDATPKLPNAQNVLSSFVADLQERLMRQTTESSETIKRLQESLATATEELKRSQGIQDELRKEIKDTRIQHEAVLDQVNSEGSKKLYASNDANVKQASEASALFNEVTEDLKEQLRRAHELLKTDRFNSEQTLAVERANHVDENRRQKEDYERKLRQREDYDTKFKDQEEQIYSLRSQLESSKTEKQLSEESTRSALTREIELQAEDLGQKLRDQQEAIASLQSEIETNKRTAQTALQTLRTSHQQNLEQERSGSAARIASLEQQLQTAKAMTSTAPDTPEPSVVSSAQELAKDSRIAELEARLATTQSQLSTVQTQLQNRETTAAQLDQQRAHTHELYSFSQTRVTDLETGIFDLRTQLEQIRTELHTSRTEATNSRSALDRARAEQERLRAQLFARNSELDDQRDDLTAAQRELRQEAENLRDEVNDARDERDQAIRAVESMRERAEAAVRKVGELLEEEKKDKARAKREAREAKGELQGMRNLLDERQQEALPAHSSPNLSSEPFAFLGSPVSAHTIDTSAVLALRTALDVQKEATASAQEELAATTAKLAALQDENAANNAAIDERLQALVRERELRWAERLKAAVKERNQFGRALMQEWGRAECGVSEPQEYRYKYVKR